jgi:hypothetical protein
VGPLWVLSSPAQVDGRVCRAVEQYDERCGHADAKQCTERHWRTSLRCFAERDGRYPSAWLLVPASVMDAGGRQALYQD